MVENVSARDAWAALLQDAEARLVDCRTDAEWQYVGIPDLRSIGRQAILVSWQYYPDGRINANFIAELREAGVAPAQQVYFLCRSGVRSLAAARLARSEGFGRVFNVGDGFEGPPDSQGHRGMVAGWKAEGLPWRQ